MASQSADPTERDAIRRLAADSQMVRVTRTAQYDLLGHQISKEEICDAVIAWIDDGSRIKNKKGSAARPACGGPRLRDEAPHPWRALLFEGCTLRTR